LKSQEGLGCDGKVQEKFPEEWVETIYKQLHRDQAFPVVYS
jgi:hypothetical protein